MADYAVFFSGSAKEKYPLEFSISLHTRAWYSNQQLVKRTLIHIMIYMVYNMVLWYMYMKVYKEISEWKKQQSFLSLLLFIHDSYIRIMVLSNLYRLKVGYISGL